MSLPTNETTHANMPLCKYVCLPLEPTSTDNVFVPNAKPCIKSSQSSVTVPSVPPVCLTTSVHDNVIKKPITCRDAVIKRLRKCLHKSTIAIF